MNSPAGRPIRPRILVLAPNWLGDAVMTSCSLDVLDAALGGDFAIRLAVNRAWLDLYREDPRLEGIIPVERPGRHDGIGGLFRLGRDLSRHGFGAVLIGPPSLRAAMIGRLAGIPVRVGYRTDGRGSLLTHGLVFPGRGASHFSEQMADLAATLAGALGRPLPEGESSGRRSPLLPGCLGVPCDPGPGPAVWAFGPGATYGAAKTWPLEQAAAFIEATVMKRGVRLVLLGDEAAGRHSSTLARTSGVPWSKTWGPEPGVVDLLGRTTLPEAVGVLRRCEAYVGNDSGLMHLAGALGVATVGIFGSSDPRWTAPLGPWTSALAAEGFPCRPCFRKTCNQDVFCLETVTAAVVLAEVESLIRRRAEGSEAP